MRDLKASTAMLAILLATPSFAEPTVALGLSVSFGGGSPARTGISARLLSDNQSDQMVATGGVTYFFGGGGFGADLGLAYNLRNGISAGLSYEFINKRPLFSLSAANIC